MTILEVSLVAILDADKEGFPRSAQSLIQIIDRAARHLNGKALLYGEKITPSMHTAIQKTEQRRENQQKCNAVHDIVPICFHNKIDDIFQLNQAIQKEKSVRIATFLN